MKKLWIVVLLTISLGDLYATPPVPAPPPARSSALANAQFEETLRWIESIKEAVPGQTGALASEFLTWSGRTTQIIRQVCPWLIPTAEFAGEIAMRADVPLNISLGLILMYQMRIDQNTCPLSDATPAQRLLWFEARRMAQATIAPNPGDAQRQIYDANRALEGFTELYPTFEDWGSQDHSARATSLQEIYDQAIARNSDYLPAAIFEIFQSRSVIPESGVMYVTGPGEDFFEWAVPLLARSDIQIVVIELPEVTEKQFTFARIHNAWKTLQHFPELLKRSPHIRNFQDFRNAIRNRVLLGHTVGSRAIERSNIRLSEIIGWPDQGAVLTQSQSTPYPLADLVLSIAPLHYTVDRSIAKLSTLFWWSRDRSDFRGPDFVSERVGVVHRTETGVEVIPLRGDAGKFLPWQPDRRPSSIPGGQTFNGYGRTFLWEGYWAIFSD